MRYQIAVLCGMLLTCFACDESEDCLTNPEYVLSAEKIVWSADVTEQERQVIAELVDDMVKVESCQFYMGAQVMSKTLPNYFSHYMSKADTAVWVGPVLTVTMPDYYIGRYEITQAQWDAVMDVPPTGNYCKVDTLKGTAAWYDVTGKGPRHAAYNISYTDAVSFCQVLSQKTGLDFRLPTDAEWECAARGGRYSRGFKFIGADTYPEVAWCYANASAQGIGNENYGVHPVGEKVANELGIYDMSGNVSEWVANSYYKYSHADVNNPQGNYGGDTLILRGGSWVQKEYTDFCPAHRKKFIQSSYSAQSFLDAIAYCGFRVVVSLP